MLVQSRQHQEILHEVLQPGVLGKDHVGQLPEVRAVRVRERNLRMLPDRGDGRPQLVRGVGDEPTLALLSALQAVEHPVHRPRQPADLVVA